MSDGQQHASGMCASGVALMARAIRLSTLSERLGQNTDPEPNSGEDHTDMLPQPESCGLFM